MTLPRNSVMPPRSFKKTARMSTGGNAPRRSMGVRRLSSRQRPRVVPVTSRRSARIARHAGVIDAVTESVILNFDLRPRRCRYKITARRADGSFVNRRQLATRAASMAENEHKCAVYASCADALSNHAAIAAAEARKSANDAMKSAADAASRAAVAQARKSAMDEIALNEYVEGCLSATLAAYVNADVDITFEKYEEIRRKFTAHYIAERDGVPEVAVGPDPDETDDELEFSHYEPSSPAYDVNPADEYYGMAEEDDIQCEQPLSPIIPRGF